MVYMRSYATSTAERLPEKSDGLIEPRFERIGSTEYAMSSPGYKHQNVLLAVGAQLREKLQASDCMTIVAPFDVYPLYDKGDEYTLVQPDIFTACDRSKLKDNRYNGAPKFIIEILSSNRSHDMVTKFNLYERAGVTEYWMVDSEYKIITALDFVDGRNFTRAYTGDDEVPLASISGCTVNFKKVFESSTLT